MGYHPEMARIVYKTGEGRICPRCGHPEKLCRCSREEAAPSGDGIVRVRRERKGRKGKTVTVAAGILLPAAELKMLASELKRKCGAGGAIRDGNLEIQGDKVDLLAGELEKRGFTVRKSG